MRGSDQINNVGEERPTEVPVPTGKDHRDMYIVRAI